jgi:hypothetical protein
MGESVKEGRPMKGNSAEKSSSCGFAFDGVAPPPPPPPPPDSPDSSSSELKDLFAKAPLPAATPAPAGLLLRKKKES